jgi:hypothetical protein
MATDSLPISDAEFIAGLLGALRDGSSVLDMPDTAPLKQWHKLQPETFDEIAHKCLVCTPVYVLGLSTDGEQQAGFKQMYGGQDANFLYDNSTFQDRYDDVMAVLRVCLPISRKRIDANIIAGLQGYCLSDESSHDS